MLVLLFFLSLFYIKSYLLFLALKVPIFNAPVLTPPAQPPEVITTDQDRQIQHTYEVWLTEQSNIVTKQLKYYESEVQKLRKMRKSMNSKQRVARKQGNELSEHDSIELQRITAEQQALQKLLESSRKQNKQHMAIIQVILKTQFSFININKIIYI